MDSEDVQQETYGTGEILCREGEISDRVGLLLSGELEVLKRHAGTDIMIGIIRRGEYFGEMGVLEGRPRSATLRARRPVTIEHMPPNEFLRRVSTDNKVAFDLLTRLSARLRHADTALTAAIGGPDEARDVEIAPRFDDPGTGILLLPDSDRLRTMLPADGHAIAALPFFFGRVPVGEETPPPIGINLTVADGVPSRLATVHFAIVREEGDISVRDFGTEFGTEVNGTLLGGDIGRQSVALESGENRIVAGGRDSPFAFRLHVS